MKVLLLADSCNPEWSSTPYFGYQICRRIIDRVDEAVLVTQFRNREAMQRHGAGKAEVVVIDSERVGAPLYAVSKLLSGGKNKGMTIKVALNYPSYVYFERLVWKRFGAEIKAGRFDIVHRVTPLSPVLPSPIASWSPAPFVIGPVNGGLRWPRAFESRLRREREWLVKVRKLHQYMPYYRATYNKAAAILAGFQHTIEDLPLRPDRADRVFNCPDVGCEASGADAPPVRAPSDRMTVLFAGRLVPYKCPDVLVRAFASSPLLRRHRLVLVGDGPEREQIQSLIAEHQLQDCVEMTGWIGHEEVERRMRAAEVFAFPSIRELGAGVVVEAMGLGMACVVVDYGGPGNYIDAAQTLGIKVPLSDEAALVRDFRAALESLAQDPQRRAELGRAAWESIQTRHTWEEKARRIVEVYDWVLDRRAARPDFFAPRAADASPIVADVPDSNH